MAEHKIAIRNRVAIADAGIELVCNNPTDSIIFEFDEEWSGLAAKTARFSWEGKYIDVPFAGNEVVVPEIFQTNYVFVGVYADNITSTPAKIKCRYSIKCLGGKNEPPTHDVYASLIELINNKAVSFVESENGEAVSINGNPLVDRVARTLANQLSVELEALAEMVVVISVIWEQGGIKNADGGDAASTNTTYPLFVRSVDYIKTDKGLWVDFPSSDRLYVHKYDADKNHLGYESYAKPCVISTTDAAFIRLKVCHSNSSEITPEYVSENVDISYVYGTKKDKLTGLKVCAYGDSITNHPRWHNAIKNALFLQTVYNLGWSDSAVTLEDKTLYINSDGTYAGNPLSPTAPQQPEGTTAVQCSFCHEDRIAYIPEDSDIVLVMGGTNDLIRSNPIGAITQDGQYDEATFIGALISTVQKIQTRLPNATVILMTPIVKLAVEGSILPRINSLGFTIADYVEAVRKVADFVGCNLIDVHCCGITLFNAANTLHDGTHPSANGDSLIAKAVVGGLQKIFSI